MTRTIALIVAAGRGARAPGDMPKQYRSLGGKPVIAWSLETFAYHPTIDAVHVVIGKNDRQLYDNAVKSMTSAPPIQGGETRQESVHLGLESLAAKKPDRVLIHDAARPFVSPDLIGRVCDALDSADAVAPLLPVTETLRRQSGKNYETVSRENVFRAQTPQGFRYDAILDAHRRYAGAALTDDLALIERAGLSIAAVAGEGLNLKLTTPDDFALAERIAGGAGDVRTGTGFDVHRFGPGDHLWLCGVKVLHTHALQGHSDADAGLHALIDAILGALGAGDIGMHFPSSDKRWKGKPSHVFLNHAADLAKKQNGVITHLDVTLICEEPKIGAYREAMRARIAQIVGLDISRVSVKATTTDGLGFTGRGEGIAAQAVATIRFS
jgi:2-C-methyl-D-erythritol 4-phosphate cytidylyltransferase/2-C-methyl-D-erythritol 2,4-cyclodiphosphate synthase